MSNPLVGEIIMFGGNFAPAGWALCQGQLLAISQNDALFSLVGTTYGGDGQNTFGLPDLRGRVPIHYGQGPGLSTIQLGSNGGAEQVTLITNHLPPHTHVPQASTNGTTDNPDGNYWANTSTGKAYAAAPGTVLMNVNAVGPTGGSQPHENMSPYLCVNYIIALYGIYPSRS